MSDNQRRALCRVLFFLSCVLPTAGILYWICHPQTAANWERLIQAQIGIETKIHSIETPGPYVTILRGVEFRDPEIGSLFKTVEARIEFGEVNQIYIPYKVQNLTDKSLHCLIENLNRHLVRSRSVDKHWKIKFAEDALIEHAVTAMPQTPENPRSSGLSLESLATRRGIAVTELQIDVGPAVPAASAPRNQ